MPPVGCTRVGLHFGDAVVGNFGGEGRIQYTAFGDGMNTAARLESANKQLKTVALISDEAKTRAGLDLLRPMGRIELIGRSTPIVVWEPAGRHGARAPRRALRAVGCASTAAMFRRWNGSGKFQVRISEDEALAKFVYRLERAGPGGHFVLGSK